jgi:drug/metabolite transporter (DMT)-like permease
MLNLLLAILCSLAIGVIFKLARGFQIDRLGLLTVNYLAAVLVALWIGVDFSVSSAGASLTLLLATGVTNGLLFILAFGLYALAIDRIGLALSAATMRIAVLIPFAASWAVWNETPGVLQIPGMVLAVAAFTLMSTRSANGDGPTDRVQHPSIVLASLFVVAGITDTTLKVFDEHLAPAASRPTYLLLAFGAAFAAGVVWLLVSPRSVSDRLSPRTAVAGVVLGLLNYGSAEFFLRALEELPGTLAYPVNHVAVLLGGTLLGVLIWREGLTRFNWLGLALAAGALVLLTA